MQLTQEIAHSLKDKQLLIFDFDGTIADTSHLHEAAFNRVLSPLGIAVDYEVIAGMTTADAMVRCTMASGKKLNQEQIQRLVLSKQMCVRQMICDHLRPLQGVDRFLKWAMQNYHLSIATSGSRGTISLALGALGYTTWFDPVVCAEDVEHAKPSPDLFEKVLDITRHKPNQALVFEDSEAGLRAARAAGIETVRIYSDSWLGFSKG